MAEEKEEVKTFKELGIREQLLEACNTLGWKNPTKIQVEAIPHALKAEECNQQVGILLENTEDSETNYMNLDPVCGQNISGKDLDIKQEGGKEDSDDSDDYFASIQRPAFLVD